MTALSASRNAHRRLRLGQPKVQIASEELSPTFAVVPRAERFRFFRTRFAYGQSYRPELVISALDKAGVRHQVQRLRLSRMPSW